MSLLLNAFLWTFIAGAATGLGAVVSFFIRKKQIGVLSYMLGVSAGIMILISLHDIWEQALKLLSKNNVFLSAQQVIWLFFSGGVILSAVIDLLIPKEKNPHEFSFSLKDKRNLKKQKKHLIRLGILMMIVLSVHNFPEGFSVFMMSLNSPDIGKALSLAVALHNIPEGIVVSIPIYYATGSQKKAFLFALGSGIAEPLGAIIGYMLLSPFLTSYVLGGIFAVISGMMIYIAFDELIPASRTYGYHNIAVSGVFTGMILIGIILSFL